MLQTPEDFSATPSAIGLDWLAQDSKALHLDSLKEAQQYQQELTKPPGSLGKLESLAIRLAAMQGKLQPQLHNIHIAIFAADHGIAEERVSAFPQAVTTEMIRNFANGGAAISVLAREINAQLQVINLGTVNDPNMGSRVTHKQIAPQTANFMSQQAMTGWQLSQALNSGKEVVDKAVEQGCQLFIAGEMGIANTTSATALACALLAMPVESLAGRGTGLDNKGLQHKISVIKQALLLHGLSAQAGSAKVETAHPLTILHCVGGFEIAALVGAYIRCAQQGLPMVVDGFICTVAMLFAHALQESILDWSIFSHCSAEPGHKIILQALDVEPLLDFNLRLGEASGAALIVPLLRSACALHSQMATFSQAQISNKDSL